MNDKEKAKAYDIAIEKAMELWNSPRTCFDIEQLESIFPELRESEDERIRRTLVEYFGPEAQLDLVRGVPIQKIRDWLEKRKEQKPSEKQDYSGLTDFERAIHRGFLCAGVENIPVTIIKETAQDCLAHLPAEWSEEDERKRNGLIKGLENRMGFGWASDPYSREEYIDWLKSLRPSWKPSEEQIGCFERLIAFKNPEPEDIKGCESLLEQLKKL